MPQDSQYTFGLAGSTERTVSAVGGLLSDPQFALSWVITPTPRAIGKNKTPSPNPVHRLAEAERSGLFLINKSLKEVRSELLQQPRVDFLIVVDFGYLLPQWSLDLPKIAPINVHPSALPRWRGSSPGQFVLLYGESTSAICIMVPTLELDAGPVIQTIPCSVDPAWNHQEYYHHAFAVASRNLPETLRQFADQKITPTPQPKISPTPRARRLNRQDGFLSWDTIQAAQAGKDAPLEENPLLADARSHHSSLSALIAAACRAFYPWPGLWTLREKNGQETRMKILSCSAKHNKESGTTLELESVQFDGKKPQKALGI